MDPTEEKKEQSQEQKANQQTHNEEEKLPTTMEEGIAMGLSKQQLRKLQKRLAAQKKKKEKQQHEAQQKNKKKQEEEHKHEKKGKGKKGQDDLDPNYVQQFENQKIPVIPNKQLPSEDQQNVLITSALPYVNNAPHLGNIIGCVLSADVYARFKRLQGNNVLYVCGTDQYGAATEVKALQEKKTPKQICDYYHDIHKNVYQWFDIGFDYFGRTSTPWHSKICQQIFLSVQKQGKIIKQDMTQCYCQNCDLWLADRFVVGICPFCQYEDARGDQCDKCQKLFNNPTQMKNYHCFVCKKTPVLRQTTHFSINLTQIQPEVEKWITESSQKGEWSDNSIGTTKSWINMGLKPKCITRDLKWGVSVPVEGYQSKVFYVWFDAPIGYISITANLLQEDYKAWWHNNKIVKLYQFMGKDNIPFHTVTFPSSLIASKQPWTLLHHISTTQYLNYQSGKFSKRNGTGVFGDSAATTGIPVEVWRYYLLVNRPQKSDTQFCWKDFVQKNNSQLLANIGNLCNRALKFCYSNYEKSIPQMKKEDYPDYALEFLEQIKQKYLKYVEILNKVEIKDGLRLTMQVSSLGNKFLQDNKPWQEQHKKSGRSKIVISVICNFIRLLSLLLQPYLPSTSAKINFLLGLKRQKQDEILGKIIQTNDFIENFSKLTQRSKQLRQPIPLFKEYTAQQTELWRQKFKGKQA